MTPIKVYFTDLDVDPNDLMPRVHRGVMPPAWTRRRFACKNGTAIINQWLADHIEGRWAIHKTYRQGQQTITIAFELDYDAVMFVLGDGPRLCNTITADY